MSSYRSFPFKNAFGLKADVFFFFACKVMQLFVIVLCVDRAVHKFDFRLVINEKGSYAVIKIHVWT